jgi:hypothetical protein
MLANELANESQTSDKRVTTNKNDKNDKNDKEVKKKSKKKKANPTPKEILDYIRQEKLSVDPKEFFDYFTTGRDPALHWIDSKGNTVYNWKQKLRTWEKFNNDNRQGTGTKSQTECRKEKTFQQSDTKDYGSGVERGFAGKPDKDL